MTVDVLTRDHGFRQWLAARAGLWLEVGVFDDTDLLVVLMAERQRLCLPRLSSLRAALRSRRRYRAPAAMRTPSTFNQPAEVRP